MAHFPIHFVTPLSLQIRCFHQELNWLLWASLGPSFPLCSSVSLCWGGRRRKHGNMELTDKLQNHFAVTVVSFWRAGSQKIWPLLGFLGHKKYDLPCSMGWNRNALLLPHTCQKWSSSWLQARIQVHHLQPPTIDRWSGTVSRNSHSRSKGTPVGSQALPVFSSF